MQKGQAKAFWNAPDRHRMVRNKMSASTLVDLNNQNMQSTASDSPRKKYIRSNICVICGLSFIQTEIIPKSVEFQCKKLMKQKLRLSHERVVIIQRVLEQFLLPEDRTNDGVCIKCYRQVSSAIKLENQKEKLKTQITESW